MKKKRSKNEYKLADWTVILFVQQKNERERERVREKFPERSQLYSILNNPNWIN